ncbi:MAG: IS4 family transposase [Acidobacteria bacterium]|nr:MAG: IS4 family transposase [Acidobacteriota bacterium]
MPARQPGARLENLRRLRPSADHHSARSLYQRTIRSGTRASRLCPRRYHHRSVFVTVSLGSIPPTQGSCQTACLARPARQHSHGGDRDGRPNSRSQYPRSVVWEPGAIYLMDRGYLDFSRLYRIHQSGAFFATRAKKRFDCQRLYSHSVDKTIGLHCNQIVTLNNPVPKRGYPERLRRIRYDDAASQKRLVFLTNNCLLPALTIAELYRCRWQVELFFRWIKQHLRIRAFYGTSENAVRTHLSLRARRDPQKTSQLGPQSALDSTDSQRLAFRENPHPASAFSFCLG